MSGLAITVTTVKTQCQGDQLNSITFFDLSLLSSADYNDWWNTIDASASNLRVYDYNGVRKDCGTPLYFSKASKRGILIFSGDTTSSENLAYQLVVGYEGEDAIQSVLSASGIIMFLDTTVASGDIKDKTSRAIDWETYGDLPHVLYRQSGPLGVSLGLGKGTSYTNSGNIRSKANNVLNRDYNTTHSYLCLNQRYAYTSKEEVLLKTIIAGQQVGVWFEYSAAGKVNVFIQNTSASNNNSFYTASNVALNTNWHLVGYSYGGTGVATNNKIFYDGEVAFTNAANTLTATILSGGPAMIGYDATGGNLGPDGWIEFPMMFNKQIFDDQVVTLKNQMLTNSTFWTLGAQSVYNISSGANKSSFRFSSSFRIGL